MLRVHFKAGMYRYVCSLCSHACGIDVGKVSVQVSTARGCSRRRENSEIQTIYLKLSTCSCNVDILPSLGKIEHQNEGKKRAAEEKTEIASHGRPCQIFGPTLLNKSAHTPPGWVSISSNGRRPSVREDRLLPAHKVWHPSCAPKATTNYVAGRHDC